MDNDKINELVVLLRGGIGTAAGRQAQAEYYYKLCQTAADTIQILQEQVQELEEELEKEIQEMYEDLAGEDI